MMNSLRRVLLLSGVLLTSVGGIAMAQEGAVPAAPSTPPSATGAPAAFPSGVATPLDAPVGQPPAGLGQVVFFRPSAVVGMPYAFHVHEGTAAYGEVSNAHYVVVNLPPGTHDFSGPEASGHLRLEIRDGQTLYVRVSMSMGLILHRASMTASTAEVFQQAVHDLERNPPHP